MGEAYAARRLCLCGRSRRNQLSLDRPDLALAIKRYLPERAAVLVLDSVKLPLYWDRVDSWIRAILRVDGIGSPFRLTNDTQRVEACHRPPVTNGDTQSLQWVCSEQMAIRLKRPKLLDEAAECAFSAAYELCAIPLVANLR
jgi:hypothetical protein